MNWMECANYRRRHKDSKKKVPGWKFPGVGTSSGLGRRAPPRKCKTIFLSHTSCIYQNKTKKIMCFFTWTLLDEQTLKHWNAERQQIRTKRFELYRVILKENTLVLAGRKDLGASHGRLTSQPTSRWVISFKASCWFYPHRRLPNKSKG